MKGYIIAKEVSTEWIYRNRCRRQWQLLSLPVLPKKGAKVDLIKLTGGLETLYVIRIDFDRVIGIYRLRLSGEPEPEYRD